MRMREGREARWVREGREVRRVAEGREAIEATRTGGRAGGAHKSSWKPCGKAKGW